jgi:hypothetical protein
VQESNYTAMIGKSALRSMPQRSGMANMLGDADLKVSAALARQAQAKRSPAAEQPTGLLPRAVST